MLAIVGVVHAQGIIHIKPNPQPYYTTGSPETFDANIDVVGDATIDFILESGHSLVSYTTLTPQNDNQVVVQSGFVAAMNRGDTIGPSLSSTNEWANGRLTIGILAVLLGNIPGGNGEDGNFAHKPSGYIGFDLVDNGTNYYGWMLASCPSLGGLTGDAGIFAYITDWAFETSPNKPIKAGQISEPISFTANLIGANEVPPNRSGHSGTGTFTLESFLDGFVLDYHLELDGSFAPSSAGIFGPANPCLNSPRLIADLGNAQIVFQPPPIPIGPVPFAPATTELNRPKPILPPPSGLVYDGQLALSSNQVVQLLQGQFYVNLKSPRFPRGELRGEIFPTAPISFSATLNSRNEIPRSASTHRGEAAFTLSGNSLSYELALDNFPFMSAGIYASPFVFPSPLNLISKLDIRFGVVVPNGGFPNAPGFPGQIFYDGQSTLNLTDEQVYRLERGEFYINVLTPRFRFGEIGGRILPNE